MSIWVDRFCMMSQLDHKGRKEGLDYTYHPDVDGEAHPPGLGCRVGFGAVLEVATRPAVVATSALIR